MIPLAALVLAAAGGGTAGAGDAERIPEASGPVTGGKGISGLNPTYEPSAVGYTRDEYFFEGEAANYQPAADLTTNGRWKVEVTETAPFKTRMDVWKPADPKAFNGTVFVEWFNVTAGFDAPPDFLMGHNQIYRDGAAWVGISAQAVGVNGGGDVIEVEGATLGGLRGSDPERYGSLDHPGDAYSYDIYTQAGLVVNGKGKGVDPFEGYDVQKVIATGESQSAARMTTYVNAVHPIADVYDGFVIHSRSATAAPFGDRVVGQDDPTIPDVVRVRRDVNVPVLVFQTESDIGPLGYARSRQPDSKNFRLWEVAGTSHVDAYTGAPAISDIGDGTAEAALLDPAQASGGPLSCEAPVNAGGQHAAYAAALAQVDSWVRDGTAPPQQRRIRTTQTGDSITFVRDDLGVVVGGIRTPIVDVPIARNDGEVNTGSEDACRLFGTTAPFDAATLAELYPGGSDEYAEKFERAAKKAVAAGIWMESEAENFVAAARQINFG